MPRKIRLQYLYAIVVFALLVPGLSLAEEPSTLKGVTVESAVPAPDAPLDMILNNPLGQEPNASFNQEEITLEKLKQMFGPRTSAVLVAPLTRIAGSFAATPLLVASEITASICDVRT